MKKIDKVRKKPASTAKAKSAGRVTAKAVTKPNISSFKLPKTDKKLVLHLGAANATKLHGRFKPEEWQGITLDQMAAKVGTKANCDITIGTISDLSYIPDNSFDAIWSVHFVERLRIEETHKLFKQCLRILKPDGFFYMVASDAQRVAEEIKKGGMNAPLYKIDSGVVTPMDILFGLRPEMQKGMTFDHHSAYSVHFLGRIYRSAGFLDVTVQRDNYNLWSIGYKRAKENKTNTKVKVVGGDINEMMRKRDEIDQPPLIWKGMKPAKVAKSKK